MADFEIESKSFHKNIIMIGLDEAGRGSWAGPIVATACWIQAEKHKLLHSDINDSKKLTSKKRKEIILSLNNLVKYSASISNQKEIDFYGLTFANTMAMKRSIFCLLKNLSKTIDIENYEIHLYVDGKYKPNFLDFDISLKNKLKLKGISVIPLVRGDSKSKTISLASIIAKETRDSIMKNYALQFPFYCFEQNFGYGTLKHREAILKYGITTLHRKSFKPISTICSK
tara:strand:+ start:1103 stop:1786 length:684 start_codon:yes stop_codon:yes gene_type:complete